MKKRSAKAPVKSSAKADNASLVTKLNPALVEEGVRRLRKVDPILKTVIDRVGPFKLKQVKNHYHALARAIVGQQISGYAARTIWGRLEKLSAPEKLSAEVVIELSDDQLRGAGLSPQKLRYFRDLSRRIADGRLSLPKLA